MVRTRYPQLKLPKLEDTIKLQQTLGKRSCSPTIPLF